MAIPEKYHLDALRKLQGTAQVTFPYDNAPNRRIERLFTVPRGTPLGVYATLQDEEFAGAVLVEQYEISATHQHIEFFQAFEDLPGPWIPGTRYDENLGPVQTRRRAVLRTDAQVASLSGTSKRSYEARGTSSLVAWEIEENWGNGSGSGGNPAYPIKVLDDYDEAKGPVEQRSQYVVATGSEVGSITVTGAPDARTLTQTKYLPTDNPALLNRVVEKFALPGPDRISYDSDAETGIPVTIKMQLIEKPADDDGYGESGGTSVEYRAISAVHGTKVTMTLNLPGGAVSFRQEVRNGNYTFPSLIFGASGSLLESTNGAARVMINWSRRAARTRAVPLRIAISYGAREDLIVPSSVFDPELQNLIYDGAFINVNERNVLNNAIGPLNFTTGTDNPLYPFQTETVSFPASPLSADEYVDQIGDEVSISYSKQKWKYGLWRMEVVKVVLR